MLVYVISKEDKPLMPTKPVIARLLLKEGKAKVINLAGGAALIAALS